MAIKLVAEFIGLIAIVPQTDASRAPLKVDAIAVNGEYATSGPPVGRHHATLMIDVADFDPKKTSAPDLTIAAPDGRRYAIWNIVDSHVTFVTDPVVGGPIQFWNAVSDDLSNETPCVELVSDIGACWRDVGWLGNPSRAVWKTVNPDYLKEQTLPPCLTPVSSLITMSEGTFRTGKPHSDLLRRVKPQFVSGGSQIERALSDHAYYEVEAQTHIEIVITRFPNQLDGGTSRKILLRASPQGKIAVAFAALPGEIHEPPTSQNGDKRIEHFRAYYELLDGPPPYDHRPVPVIPKSQLAAYAASSSGNGRKNLYLAAAASSSDCPPAVLTPPLR